MPVVAPSNAYLKGLAKQTNEATVPATAAYSFPVFGSDLGPRFDLRRIDVTDANAVQGDPYKGPSFWQADSMEVPTWDDSLGLWLVSMWPTDTPSGTAPSRLHAFSGLGSVAQPWMAFYTHWTDAAINYEQTFGKGLVTGLTFAITQEGGPMHLTASAIGQEVTGATTAAFPATTADQLSQGYFGMQFSGATIELDIDTPNLNPSVAVTNVRTLSVAVTRTASPEPTATGVNITNLSQGKIELGGSMEVLWDSVALDTYKTSYFGGVGGTTLSSTLVYGALELNFKHSITATSLLSLYAPKVVFWAQPAVPNPDGSALVQTVNFAFAKPSSGDHLQPSLTNNVTAAY